MPELPPPGRLPTATPSAQKEIVPYAELHCRTNFSFLEGASHPDELATRAGELGYRALAVTDRNSLAGVVRAHVAAKEAELKLLVGAELTPVDAARRARLGDRPRGLWPARAAPHARPARRPQGRMPADVRRCRRPCGRPARRRSLAHEPTRADLPRATATSSATAATPSPNCIAASTTAAACIADLATAKDANLPLVAANDVHYHVPERRPLQDVLTAIRHGCTVAELGDAVSPTANGI